MNALTRHALKRCQQRGIPTSIVDYLLDFGEEVHSCGAEILFFSKGSMSTIAKEVGRDAVKFLQKYANSYLVLDDGKVLTVGHRYKRIKTN